MTTHNSTAILTAIREAFAQRSLPPVVIESGQCLGSEIADVETALDFNWDQVTAKELDTVAEFIFWLTPEAFCWFLPRIAIRSLEMDSPNLTIVSFLIGIFGSPIHEKGKLNGFLAPRLEILSADERRALKRWFEFLLEIPEMESTDGNNLCHAVDLLSAQPN